MLRKAPDTKAVHILRLVGRRTLDLILPPHCAGCGAPVREAQTLCASCWQELHFLTGPACQICGIPFNEKMQNSGREICAQCTRYPPPYRRARAALEYNGASKALILPFKHADRHELAMIQAKWLLQAGPELLDHPDMLIPVPLHNWRLFKRRYNQAALLVAKLTQLTHIQGAYQILLRHRTTVNQGRFGRTGRRRNVRGAFRVPEPGKRRVDGKTVLLVDDVMTTGATVSECARVLKRAGARHVDVLTVARVER